MEELARKIFQDGNYKALDDFHENFYQLPNAVGASFTIIEPWAGAGDTRNQRCATHNEDHPVQPGDR